MINVDVTFIPGNNLLAGVRRSSDGFWFNFNSSTFESSPSFANKTVALTELDDGLYVAQLNVGSADTGRASVVIFDDVDDSAIKVMGVFIVGGNSVIPAYVNQFAAGAIGATVFATDAIAADALAGSAINKITAGVEGGEVGSKLNSIIGGVSSLDASFTAAVDAMNLAISNIAITGQYWVKAEAMRVSLTTERYNAIVKLGANTEPEENVTDLRMTVINTRTGAVLIEDVELTYDSETGDYSYVEETSFMEPRTLYLAKFTWSGDRSYEAYVSRR